MENILHFWIKIKSNILSEVIEEAAERQSFLLLFLRVFGDGTTLDVFATFL